MANLTLRFRIEQHIVHETTLSQEERAHKSLNTVGELKRYLAQQLSLPVETVVIYDSDAFLRLAEDPETPVRDLHNDVKVPAEDAVWYWSYLAEEPEEYEMKKERCSMILETAIEQVTIDMNMALFGIYRKVVSAEDGLSEQQWIRINEVPRGYVSRVHFGTTEEEKLRVYGEQCEGLLRIEKRLKERVEVLGRDMGLAVGNIQAMFWNLKRMEENVELLDFNGPIGEADLQVSVVARGSVHVNCGLLAGIANGPLPPALDLPPTTEVKHIVEAITTDYPATAAVTPVRVAPPTPRRRQSLVTNALSSSTVLEEHRAHLVTNITSRSLDFAFTSNLFDIQKVSGIFVSLKKERAEVIKMVHQLETRRQLWFLREYLFHLRTLIPIYQKFTLQWKAVASDFKLKRRRITHISQGVTPFYEAGYLFSSATEYRTLEVNRVAGPPADPDPRPEVEVHKAQVTFAQEVVLLMTGKGIEVKSLAMREMATEVYDAEGSVWRVEEEGKGFFFGMLGEERVGWYVMSGGSMVQEATFDAKDLPTLTHVAELLWRVWKALGKTGRSCDDYVWGRRRREVRLV
eukprot:TRINITY_DN977_c0_g1_i2.p1 TRINITY_DN977_c0_g1~~TRINITY_DN977_c0_g1_i2.p1  ORF type:complete len:574 (+),score=55.13 TRINITY_DN977_c0_g1_i2:54-1775(+)